MSMATTKTTTTMVHVIFVEKSLVSHGIDCMRDFSHPEIVEQTFPKTEGLGEGWTLHRIQ